MTVPLGDEHAQFAPSKSSRSSSASLPRSMLPAEAGHRNAWLEDLLPHLSPFLDAHAILILRQTCSFLYNWKWKSYAPNQHMPRPLRFSAFRGFDGQLICDKLLRTTLSALHPTARAEGVILDLSHCVQVRDTQLAFLTSAAQCFVPTPQPESRLMYTKLAGIQLDFCMNVSDKGLSALLAAHLPHLSRLSLRCIRSETFSGQSLRDGMAELLWPKFNILIADFTSISLDAVTEVARFIKRPKQHDDTNITDPAYSMPSQTPGKESPATISFVGSAASKSYLELIGAKHLIKSLAMALNSGDPEKIRETASQASSEIDELLVARQEEHDDPLASFMVNEGSRYLVNVPVTCPTSEEGGVNVWTLPISVAVLNGKLPIVQALVEAGAVLDVIDHLGKSPLYRAVCSGNYEIAKYLIDCGVQLKPLNVLTQSPLNAAIEHKDRRVTSLLLESGYPLNLKCPAIRSFKSPLHVACEVGDEETIHSLLDWGANPNTFSGTYKNSPAMIAYRANPRFLPVFLQGGPGGHFTSLPLASEILTAAIAKNDVRSAELLVTLFPSLLTRQHPTWSVPHIQASKTGKAEVLEAILSAYLSSVVSERVSSVQGEACGALHYFGHPTGCCEHTHKSKSALLRDLAESSDERVNRTADMESQPAAATIDGFPISSPARIQQDGPTTLQTDTLDDAADFQRAGLQPTFVTDRREKVKLWAKNSLGDQSGREGCPKRQLSLEPLVLPSDSECIKACSDSQISAGRPCVDMTDFLSIRDDQTGNTALHYTAEDGRMDCLKILLRYGADVDVVNNENQSPLHLACLEDRRDVVELLVYLGCRLSIRDSVAQETPLMTAIKARHDEIALVLVKHQAHRASHGLFEFPDNEDVAPEGQPSKSTAPATDAPDRRKQSALEYALYFGRYEIAQQLMADPKTLNEVLDDEEALKSTYATVCERLAGADVKPLQSRKVLQKFIKLCKTRIASTQGLLDVCESPVMSDMSSADDGDEVVSASGAQTQTTAPPSKDEQIPCIICSLPSHLIERNYSFCVQCHYDCAQCRRLSAMSQDPAAPSVQASECAGDEGDFVHPDTKTRTRARRLQERIKIAAKLLFQRNRSADSP